MCWLKGRKTGGSVTRITESLSSKKKLTSNGGLKLQVSIGYNASIDPIFNCLNPYFDDEVTKGVPEFEQFSQNYLLAMSPEKQKTQAERWLMEMVLKKC